MTITYLVGDATSPQGEGNKIIVHCCNNVGAWGAGFVLALSRKWKNTRDSYLSWADICMNSLPLGEVQFVDVTPNIRVANLIGQSGIRSSINPTPVSYSAIGQGLAQVRAEAELWPASVHMPRMGCGLAGGNWQSVEPLIKKFLGHLDVFVYDLH